MVKPHQGNSGLGNFTLAPLKREIPLGCHPPPPLSAPPPPPPSRGREDERHWKRGCKHPCSFQMGVPLSGVSLQPY